ncbi:MAG TPA: sugar ABC transporter permease [Nocardioides bacterium]|uniref:carbohydrate ABC transporter permease n=1 Tax=uncultured Nocardioides sp. TaxID=198441 RepID=UPI000EBB00AB|nr:carbohydrate ABC transporter permease [uncultured Nocardioides sp.]HCB07954.1 sugar ABC transporter permease [Nocardioides sp.]
MTAQLERVGPAVAVRRPPRPRRSRRVAGRRRFHISPTVVALTLVTALSAFPLYFMVVMASRPNSDITSVPPPLTPGGELFNNIDRVLTNPDITFTQAVINSVLVASVCTVSVVLFCSMAGFAFAKLRFVGRQPLLAFVLLTMMVPIQLGLIPLYMLMTKLHLAGTLPAVTLPFLVSGFGVFLMRQFCVQALPDELLEAARLDGASIVQTFWYVVLPVLRPAAAVLALLTFMERWNDFLWPYLVLDLDHPTVQVALSRLAGGYYTDQALIMAGTLLGVLPLLVVFILFGRQIVGGIMEGGIKS